MIEGSVRVRYAPSPTGEPHVGVGDAVYGHAIDWCPRQFLHAHVLGFRRPSDGAYVEFRADLPPDLEQALAWAKRDG